MFRGTCMVLGHSVSCIVRPSSFYSLLDICLQAINSDIRPQGNWVVRLVTLYYQFSSCFVGNLDEYVRVNMLEFLPSSGWK